VGVLVSCYVYWLVNGYWEYCGVWVVYMSVFSFIIVMV